MTERRTASSSSSLWRLWLSSQRRVNDDDDSDAGPPAVLPPVLRVLFPRVGDKRRLSRRFRVEEAEEAPLTSSCELVSSWCLNPGDRQIGVLRRMCVRQQQQQRGGCRAR
eukprot:GHVU01083602.1.p1 GENE.GHVU01083602.1~~GHVU01083602.1.p1  ORF type:complete len:110 (+),score=17.00 GHVU01083602.1:333-662(+)